jgi:hypothetical protein
MPECRNRRNPAQGTQSIRSSLESKEVGHNRAGVGQRHDASRHRGRLSQLSRTHNSLMRHLLSATTLLVQEPIFMDLARSLVTWAAIPNYRVALSRRRRYGLIPHRTCEKFRGRRRHGQRRRSCEPGITGAALGTAISGGAPTHCWWFRCRPSKANLSTSA